MNVTAVLSQGARRHPEREALRLPDLQLTYSALEDLVQRLAGALRSRGIQSGDTVALLMPNSAGFVVSYLGVLRLGAVALPVNALCRGGELLHCLRTSRARGLIYATRLRGVVQEAATQGDLPDLRICDGSTDEGDLNLDDMIREEAPWPEVPDVREEHPAAMIFTHAVDGWPRGAVLSHRSLRVNALDSAFHFGLRRPCPVMTALPLFHTFGATSALLAPLVLGGTAQILPRFSGSDTVRRIREWRPTVFSGVPTMYASLLGARGADPDALSSVQLWICGGMSLPAPIQVEFERMARRKLREGYGLTEASPVCTFNCPPFRRKIGSIGLPYRSMDARVVDPEDPHHRELSRGAEGELVVRGPNVFLGYHDDPEMTARKIRSGWLHTGDRARMDREGYLFITGLYKPMFLTGGFNIYPQEVMRHLEAMPEIQTVLGLDSVPDMAQGELVRARVRLPAGSQIGPDQLTGLARRRMALYKVPRIWEIEGQPT